MTIKDGTHSGSRNVVGKLTLHNVQKPQNQKSVFIPRWKSKTKNAVDWLVVWMQLIVTADRRLG
jgi:hypothetical protein